MMELTVLPEQLTPYLPYKLKFGQVVPLEYSNDNQGSDDDPLYEIWLFEMGSISLDHDISFHEVWDLEGGNYSFNGNISGFQPVLRPLADITSEVTIDGETFIPIVKIFDIPFGVESAFTDRTAYRVAHRVGGEIVTHEIPKDMEICKYWIMTRLLEMHFDVFGLIDKGLAIDINYLNHLYKNYKVIGHTN